MSHADDLARSVARGWDRVRELEAQVAELESRLRELTEWRPMETLPRGESRIDEDGDPYILLDDDSSGPFRVLDSAENEYVVHRADGDCSHEWEIWTGSEFAPLELEEGVTLDGWLPLAQDAELGPYRPREYAGVE